MQNYNLITIRKTAEILGVSVDTLRRWDKKGTFSAIKSPGGHRYYSSEQIDLFRRDIFSMAKDWSICEKGVEPKDEFYCPNSIVFQTRLMRIEKEVREKFKEFDWGSLIISAIGEIGNNAFDHNLGNWRDIPGIFFEYDLQKRQIVIADRGQGVFTTLRRVKPELATDADALNTAFTEVLSGRAPEVRGNGLKLVKLIVERYPLNVDFYSGNARVILRQNKQMKIEKSHTFVFGCLVYLTF